MKKVLFRFHRSSRAPVKGVSSSRGMEEENSTTPRARGERVRRYTSQPVATFCIQKPVRDTACPAKKSR